MLFNSYLFIFIFLPLTLITYFTLARFRFIKLAIVALTLASLTFYGYWNPPYLLLLGLSILVNFSLGSWLAKITEAKTLKNFLLGIGIIFNLAFIAYYKYAGFLFSNILPDSAYQALDQLLQFDTIFLPLGISFFTFQQITYLVDGYQGSTKDYNFVDYCLFVSFFPQLIAGPIVHHTDIIPQFYKAKAYIFSHRNFALGVTSFILGLSKKVLIADNISPWVTLVFGNATEVNFVEAWVGALSYTLQLYFDFSGYSDMAIGLGLMFNIDIPNNFNSPYKAISITDFWRRWHITLSNFLRDYLYIPLGGSRKGEWRRYSNLLITMLLGGLWHGAGWTFVLWGGLHGVYLSLNHFWRKQKIALPWIVSWGITFGSVMVGWVLFRANSLADAGELLQTMFGLKGIVLPGAEGGKLAFLTRFGVGLTPWGDFAYLPTIGDRPLQAILALIGLTLACLYLPNTQEIVQRLRPRWYWAMGIGLLTAFSLLSLNRVSEFLYFQF
jgi:alginate O-acetyltransferase complex protein AlgI